MKIKNKNLFWILIIVLMALVVVFQVDSLRVLRDIDEGLEMRSVEEDVDLAPGVKICQTNCVDVYLKDLDECKKTSDSESCISAAFEMSAECELGC